MKKVYTVIGLDIGSAMVSAVMANITPEGSLSIISHESVPSHGVARGAIVDLRAAVEPVHKVLQRIHDKIPHLRGEIVVSISGESIKGEHSRGMVPLSMRGREVTRKDMEHCANAAGTIRLAFDREIIHKIVQNYSIDNQAPLKNPLGLYASRLSCQIFVITSSVNHIQNIYKCVNGAGYDAREVVFSGIADGSGLLGQGDKDAGAMLVDMGASVTECSFYSDGALSDIEIIPLGALDVKGSLRSSAEAKVICEKIKDGADTFISRGGKIGVLALTGGLSYTEEAVEFLQEHVQFPVKMGALRQITGDISSVESLRFATALGLVRYAQEKYRQRLADEKHAMRRFSDKVIDIFNNYF